MPDHAICDHCNGRIEHGEGYTFFSSASIGLPGMEQLTGNMMLCEECTNRIITVENWLRAPSPSRREISGADFLANPSAMFDTMRRTNEDSIIQNCQAHGFTPNQAKAKARELAQQWWIDPESAQRESARFWSSKSRSSTAPARRPAAHQSRPQHAKFPKGCLIGCGALSLLLVSFCLLGVWLMQSEQKVIRSETENVLNLITQGKTAEAYANSSMLMRSEMDEAGFAASVQELKLTGYVGWQEKKLTNHRKPQYGWTVEGYAIVEGGRTVPITLEFIQENKQWKLRLIRRS